MNKVILLYILTILLIAALAAFMHTPAAMFSTVNFPHSLHIILEGTNSLLMFLIFLFSNYIFSKTNDERLAILAGGFLVGSIWNFIHIITIKTFPFDLLSLANIQNKPSIVYLLFSNLILPLAVYFSLTHKPTNLPVKKFSFKVYSIYFLIFVTLTALPIFVSNFLPNLTPEFNLITHSLEFINYSLFITLAFIVINIRQANKVSFFPTFTTGLIISGLAGLFYINPSILPLNELLAHIFQGIGLVFMLVGINKFAFYSKYLRFKDELVAHLCLVLICFYIVFISTISLLFNVIFPPVSAYIFIEFILIFQFVVYLISNEVSKPLTNIIDTLSKYSPGEDTIDIPIVRKDEIGMLTQKINTATKLSRLKIMEVSKTAQRNRSIIKIFESMRRISKPDIIKNSIVEEIKNSLNPDRIFIALYDSTSDSFYYDKYIEHLPSKTLVDFKDEHHEEKMLNRLNWFLKPSLELCYSNLDEYIKNNSLTGTKRGRILKCYGIKSCCNMPIYYAGNLLGCLMVQHTKEYVKFDQIDVNYLKTMATHLGVVINNQKN